MSTQIDRLIPPSAEELKQIRIIEGKHQVLQNGIDLHYINAGTAEVLRVDLVFDAGVRKQQQNAIAPAVSYMLSEGTKDHTAEQLANALDFYGAYFQTRCFADDALVTLYCQKKHFASCIPHILEILYESVFPEAELNIYKQNAIQRLMVNKQRNAFLVRRLFYSSIFGNIHPYGIYSESGDYENISRETLISFYQDNYRGCLKYILLSGSIDEQILEQAASFFTAFSSSPATKNSLPSSGKNPGQEFIQKEDSVQSAIKIGRKLFNRTHVDYRKMQVLNLVLGGYFGSRLMKNIREEKGLTYGIYSTMESYFDDGCFYIETEINNALRAQGLTEIYKEIGMLRENLIDEDELKTAKNYLLGSFLRSIDGPFSLAERHKILIDYGLGYDYYYDYIDLVKNITAPELRDLANQYLQKQDLTEIVVGRQ